MKQKRALFAIKTILWVSALSPGVHLVISLLRGSLGVNPVEKLTLWTGMTALVLLLSSLAITPIRRISGWNLLIKLRRPLGLFAFFYASAHFVIWFAFYNIFDFRYMWADILERRFITAGMAALLVMLPLALTSTRWAIRKLGKKWSTLHRAAYLAGTLGVVHYFWLVKADTRLPSLFALVLASLLGFRALQSRAAARIKLQRSSNQGRGTRFTE